jgi:flagellar protein FlaG
MDVNRVDHASAPPPPVPRPTGSADAAPVIEFPAVSAAPAIEPPNRPAERIVDDLPRAVGELNQTLSSHHRHLSISMHQATGRRVVTVYDTDTNEVIREIPPERVLDAHASLLQMAGLILDVRG